MPIMMMMHGENICYRHVVVRAGVLVHRNVGA